MQPNSFSLRQRLSSTSVQTLLFLSCIAVLRILFVLLLQVGSQAFGLPREVWEQVLMDNELLLQALSVGCALVLVNRVPGRAFLRRFMPWPRWDGVSFFEYGLHFFTRGFFWAALVIFFSLFCGWVKLTWPQWSAQSLWLILPAWSLQVLTLILWVVVLDTLRVFLWTLWVKRGMQPGFGRAAIILFDTLLLFRALGATAEAKHSFLTFIVSALLASLFLLQIESEEGREGDSESRALARSTFQMGFWIALVHVFGLSFSGFKWLSIIYSQPGPTGNPMGSWAPAGVAGHIPFLFVLFATANLIVWRHFKGRAPLARPYAPARKVDALLVEEALPSS